MATPTTDSFPHHAPHHARRHTRRHARRHQHPHAARPPTGLELANAGWGKAMGDPAVKAIGRTIQRHREHREMSRLELGLEIGVSHEQMRKYELGTNRVSAARLLRIAEALDVPISVLFAGLEGNWR